MTVTVTKHRCTARARALRQRHPSVAAFPIDHGMHHDSRRTGEAHTDAIGQGGPLRRRVLLKDARHVHHRCAPSSPGLERVRVLSTPASIEQTAQSPASPTQYGSQLGRAIGKPGASC